jgi:hypothetical protein
MQWFFSAIHHKPGFRLAEGALPGRDRDRGLSFVNILLEYTPRFCSHLRSFVHCFFFVHRNKILDKTYVFFNIGGI